MGEKGVARDMNLRDMLLQNWSVRYVVERWYQYDVIMPQNNPSRAGAE